MDRSIVIILTTKRVSFDFSFQILLSVKSTSCSQVLLLTLRSGYQPFGSCGRELFIPLLIALLKGIGGI